MKNRITGKSNKQSKDLRHLMYVLKNIFRYHKYLYLMELFDNMSQMPFPEGLVHDPDYGKLIIVNNGEKPEEIRYEMEKQIDIKDLTNETLRNKEKSENKEIKKNKEETKKEEIKEETKKEETKKEDIKEEVMGEVKEEINVKNKVMEK